MGDPYTELEDDENAEELANQCRLLRTELEAAIRQRDEIRAAWEQARKTLPPDPDLNAPWSEAIAILDEAASGEDDRDDVDPPLKDKPWWSVYQPQRRDALEDFAAIATFATQMAQRLNYKETRASIFRRSENVRRALAQQGERVPEGWKLVPEEPTERMVELGAIEACRYVDFTDQITPIDWEMAEEIYNEMLDAAPDPGEADVEEEG